MPTFDKNRTSCLFSGFGDSSLISMPVYQSVIFIGFCFSTALAGVREVTCMSTFDNNRTSCLFRWFDDSFHFGHVHTSSSLFRYSVVVVNLV